MKYEEYAKYRLDDQIDWYDKKSQFEKKWYYHIRTLQLVLSASIPILTGFVLDYHWILKIIAIIGALITVLEGVSSVKKYHEKWIQYRTISEALKKEKYTFSARAGVYDSENIDVLKTLVERCENIISSENINWANMDINKKGKS